MFAPIIALLIHNKQNPITLLMRDYHKIKDLFDEFYYSELIRGQNQIVQEIIQAIKMHIAMKEEILYPALMNKIDTPILVRVKKELYRIKILITELETMHRSSFYWDAAFKVLSEKILHHIREEEFDVISQIKTLNIDLSEIAYQILSFQSKLNNKKLPALRKENSPVLKKFNPSPYIKLRKAMKNFSFPTKNPAASCQALS